MNIKEQDKRLASFISDARFYKLSNVFLSIALLFSLFILSQKEQSVVVIPPKLSEKIIISSNMADSGYKKGWANYIAMLAGNVTPKNVKFVADSMLSFMTSEVYHRLSGEFGSQVFKIEKEGRRTRFTPSKVIYEQETDKVFVTGEYEIMLPSSSTVSSGSSKKRIRKDKVYELVIAIEHGYPLVKHFDTYYGQIKDKKYLMRIENMEKNRG
jgi:conjugal transfer pilus assembly protein TraE